MSLSKCQHWSLKDKNGKPPPSDIIDYIQKLDKNLLFPCPRSADDLEMPMNKSAVPKELNNFMIFRRQLAHVAKQLKLSNDGKVTSRAASYIWNGASESEKQSYVQIAKELKKRHHERYPPYTYEKRKRKTSDEDFIVYTVDIIKQKKRKRAKKSVPRESAELSPVHVKVELTSPLPTSKGNEEFRQVHVKIEHDASTSPPPTSEEFSPVHVKIEHDASMSPPPTSEEFSPVHVKIEHDASMSPPPTSEEFNVEIEHDTSTSPPSTSEEFSPVYIKIEHDA